MTPTLDIYMWMEGKKCFDVTAVVVLLVDPFESTYGSLKC